MILKNKTQGNFVIVSQSIMHDKSLKLFDRGLLITLMSLPDNWVFNITGLTRILCDGRDAISSGINRLIEHGYLVKEQLRVDGKFSENCLRINVISENSPTEEPITENPSTDKPLSEKTTTGIPEQYKNNKSNIQGSNNKICNISTGKEAANGTARRKQDHSHGSRDGKWTQDEIDLYGL